MSDHFTPFECLPALPAGAVVPAVVAACSEKAAWRYLEFFAVNIRNPNTRAAYARAVSSFFVWCELEIIQRDQFIKDEVNKEVRDLLSRRVAELTRESELLENHTQFSHIDTAREQKLISMSAPLVSEMATALRKSADTL